MMVNRGAVYQANASVAVGATILIIPARPGFRTLLTSLITTPATAVEGPLRLNDSLGTTVLLYESGSACRFNPAYDLGELDISAVNPGASLSAYRIIVTGFYAND